MTFLEIAQEVLDYTKRPDSSLPQAKSEVNKAILWAQRKHVFEYSKLSAEFTYPANRELVPMNEVAGITTPLNGYPPYVVKTVEGPLNPNLEGAEFIYAGHLVGPVYTSGTNINNAWYLMGNAATGYSRIVNGLISGATHWWENTEKDTFAGTYTPSGPTTRGTFRLEIAQQPNLRFRSLISVTSKGNPIPLSSFEVLTEKKKSFTDKHTPAGLSTEDIGLQYSEFSRRNYGRVGYIKSGSNFGLFPVPRQETPLQFFMSTWLPRLVKDDDTNFLLEYGSDLILFRALLTFNNFLKADDRLEINYSLVNDAWNTLMQWDSDLTSSIGI